MTSNQLPNCWLHNYILNPGVLCSCLNPECPSFRLSTFVKEKQGTEGKRVLQSQISATLLSQEGGALLQETACGALPAACPVSVCLEASLSCQSPVCQSRYLLPRGAFLYRLPVSRPVCYLLGQTPSPPHATRGAEDLLD